MRKIGFCVGIESRGEGKYTCNSVTFLIIYMEALLLMEMGDKIEKIKNLLCCEVSVTFG